MSELPKLPLYDFFQILHVLGEERKVLDDYRSIAVLDDLKIRVLVRLGLIPDAPLK